MYKIEVNRNLTRPLYNCTKAVYQGHLIKIVVLHSSLFQEYLDLEPLESPLSSGASDSQYSSMTANSTSSIEGSAPSITKLQESPV